MKKYRILPLLLIVCLLLTAAFPAAAAKNTADNSADTPQSTANVSSDGVPQSTVQAQEGSYVFGSDAVKSALDEKLKSCRPTASCSPTRTAASITIPATSTPKPTPRA